MARKPGLRQTRKRVCKKNATTLITKSSERAPQIERRATAPNAGLDEVTRDIVTKDSRDQIAKVRESSQTNYGRRALWVVAPCEPGLLIDHTSGDEIIRKDQLGESEPKPVQARRRVRAKSPTQR